jgi:hypothetical protein
LCATYINVIDQPAQPMAHSAFGPLLLSDRSAAIISALNR